MVDAEGFLEDAAVAVMEEEDAAVALAAEEEEDAGEEDNGIDGMTNAQRRTVIYVFPASLTKSRCFTNPTPYCMINVPLKGDARLKQLLIQRIIVNFSPN